MASNTGQPTSEDEKLEIIRHSTAHVMAEAVQSIFPDAKFGIGPSIESGFYYDFDLPRSLTPEDLPLIEAKIKEIIALNVPFVTEEISKQKARQLFADQPYKLELIDEIPDEKVSLYRQGSFVDLDLIKSGVELFEAALIYNNKISKSFNLIYMFFCFSISTY